MRIANFIDTQVVGGAEVLVVKLSRRLSVCGFRPMVIHFGNPWIAEACRRFGLEQAPAPHHRLYKSFKTLIGFARHFRRFLAQQGVDILHCHLVDPVIAGALSTALSPVKHIGTLHDTHTLVERPAKRLPLKLAALTGTRLVAVSNEMGAFLESECRISKKRLHVIHNGVEPADHGSRAGAVRRADLGLAQDDVVAACVGRLVPVKAHAVLLRAWGLLCRSAKAKLVVIGDGPLRAELERMLREQGLCGAVRFLGLRNDVPDLLKLADIFVLSSFSEGLSCSILEAMAAGLPVVATAVGGNRELVHEAVNGYLVPAGDPKALAARLAELIASPEVRKSLGSASRRLAEAHFSIDRMVEQYARLYHDVASPGRCHG